MKSQPELGLCATSLTITVTISINYYLEYYYQYYYCYYYCCHYYCCYYYYYYDDSYYYFMGVTLRLADWDTHGRRESSACQEVQMCAEPRLREQDPAMSSSQPCLGFRV